MNKQLLPFESKNGNYEGEATQVLVLLSNYYADKKLFDENTDEYGVNFGVNFDFLKQKRHPRNNS